MDETTKPPTKKKISFTISSKMALVGVGAIALLAAAFYAGTVYQKSHDHLAKQHARMTRSRGGFGGINRRFGGHMSTSTVTAISSTSITVKASDGTAKTYAIDSGTRVLKDHAQVAASDVVVGDNVVIMPSRTDTSIAERIIVNPAMQSTAPVDPGSVQTN